MIGALVLSLSDVTRWHQNMKAVCGRGYGSFSMDTHGVYLHDLELEIVGLSKDR